MHKGNISYSQIATKDWGRYREKREEDTMIVNCFGAFSSRFAPWSQVKRNNFTSVYFVKKIPHFSAEGFLFV